MKASNFLDIYRELIDENPFAARAVLKILEIEFTHEIPTLAVTQGDKPRLLVNLGFLQAHCHTDEHVKAVICHEFLHVLLRHTEREATPTPAWNLALDAVINAIIHRSLGTQYSSMMSTFYKDAQGPELLLRPPQAPILKNTVDLTWQEVASWEALYEGNLTASDIHEIARDFKHRDLPAVDRLLGSHEANSEPNAGSHEANSKPNAGSHEANSEPNAESPEAEPPSTDLNAALDRVREYLSGNGRWSEPWARGASNENRECVFDANPTDLLLWKRATYKVLKQALQPDPTGPKNAHATAGFQLPVLSPSDRRATLRARWSPFIPEAQWSYETPCRSGTAQVYLDVSGSMFPEMPFIVALLHRLYSSIRQPLWAFSNEVTRARIENGQLISGSTGGTSMECVLDHIERTRPRAAVVVTDGYIEDLQKSKVARQLAGTRLHAIVTLNGDTSILESAGIPTTQLQALPT